MASSTRVNTKIRKPRPKEVGVLVGVRLQPDLLEVVDKVAAERGTTRPEALRYAFHDWAIGQGLMDAPPDDLN